MSPRMVRVIEDLAGDWHRLDERIEGLSGEIGAIARQDAGCERLMSVPSRGLAFSSGYASEAPAASWRLPFRALTWRWAVAVLGDGCPHHSGHLLIRCAGFPSTRARSHFQRNFLTIELGVTPPTATALKAKIDQLRVRTTMLEALVATRQEEFRATLERDRAEHLMAELLRMAAELMSAKETASRLEGELNDLRAQRSERSWWQRLLNPGR